MELTPKKMSYALTPSRLPFRPAGDTKKAKDNISHQMDEKEKEQHQLLKEMLESSSKGELKWELNIVPKMWSNDMSKNVCVTTKGGPISMPSLNDLLIRDTDIPDSQSFGNMWMFDIETPPLSPVRDFAWLQEKKVPLVTPSCKKGGSGGISNIKTRSNFNDQHGLIVHSCLICCRGFSQYEDLINHEKKKHYIHPDTMSERFYCDYCDRCFVTSGSFAAHMSRHRSCRCCGDQLKSALMTVFGRELDLSDPICEACNAIEKRAIALKRGAAETAAREQMEDDDIDGESYSSSSTFDEDYMNSSDFEEDEDEEMEENKEGYQAKMGVPEKRELEIKMEVDDGEEECDFEEVEEKEEHKFLELEEQEDYESEEVDEEEECESEEETEDDSELDEEENLWYRELIESLKKDQENDSNPLDSSCEDKTWTGGD